VIRKETGVRAKEKNQDWGLFALELCIVCCPTMIGRIHPRKQMSSYVPGVTLLRTILRAILPANIITIFFLLLSHIYHPIWAYMPICIRCS